MDKDWEVRSRKIEKEYHDLIERKMEKYELEKVLLCISSKNICNSWK